MIKYPFKIEYNKNIDKGIEKYFKSGYNTNKKFFKINLKHFKIKIWYSRKDFNKKLKSPVRSRFPANSGMKQNENMDVMSPSILRRENSKFNFDTKYLNMLSRHEMCHRFMYQKWKFIVPCWLNEGLCCIVAKQSIYLDKNKKKIIPLKKLHYFKDWTKYYNYWQAYSMTKFLIKKYGKKKLNKLLKNLKENENYSKFCKKFEIIYKITPEEFENIWKTKMV